MASFDDRKKNKQKTGKKKRRAVIGSRDVHFVQMSKRSNLRGSDEHVKRQRKWKEKGKGKKKKNVFFLKKILKKRSSNKPNRGCNTKINPFSGQCAATPDYRKLLQLCGHTTKNPRWLNRCGKQNHSFNCNDTQPYELNTCVYMITYLSSWHHRYHDIIA